MANELVKLERTECLSLLHQHQIGRVAVTIDRQPHVVPVTYAADDEGTVVFRTGADTVLTKIDLERVAFEIDGIDEPARSGWSVCIHGFGREITEDPSAHELRRRLPSSWAPAPRPRWFAIYIREMAGRRLLGPPNDDVSWFPGIPWS